MLHYLTNRLRNFLVLISLSFSFASYAQDCNQDEIVNLPGVYKGPGKGSVSGIAKTDLAQQQAITQIFTKMVMDNYQPKGMNISYGKAHFSPPYYKPNGLNTGNHYNANFFLMYFYCNHENKMEQIAETHSIIEFEVNGWKYPNSFFVNADANDEDPETDVFATIKNKPVWNEKGYWTMTDTVYIVRDVTHFHHIVTKNKELPFVFVTKREYLEKLKVYYEKLLHRELRSIENSGDKDTDFGKSSIENYKSFYGKSIQNIDDFLTNSPEEMLNEVATAVGGAPPSEFEEFKESIYREWIIKPNPAYYDSKSPKYTPHFIDVLFSIYEPQVACMNAKNDILKIIDFKLLQSIVDNRGVTATQTSPGGAKTGTPKK
jgi:hypothetical protein